ncbi:acyltransferase [Acinetobacter pittii]|uniref:acyltransferase family protein n=1 Tax=Acinetobacter pittii TaxID=48296 RepID=UPI0021CD7FA2|nr:acyltransferase family protein [Acinetobacter pittii]MCU4548757.1 acyltransferase [Acinetobacter pittii]
MNYRNDIQILRGVAVAFVVLFHLEIAGLSSGFLGVDVFFVISGFLMAILYKHGEIKKFFQRRANRLLPSYFVTVIFTFLFSLFLVLPSELNQVSKQAIFSIFFANNIGFWMQNSYFSKTEFNPLLHLWSLGVEIQFYLFVPLLVWLFRKSKFFLPLILGGSFLSCLFMLGISPKTSFYMMPLRVWEFLIGFGVAYYLTNNGNLKFENKRILGLVSLIALLLIPFIPVDGQSFSRIFGHPGLFALLVCLLTASVLSFGLPKKIEDSLVGKLLVKIGEYSYSIYLVHFPIIVLYLYQPFSGTILHTDSLIDKTKILLFIVITAILIHKYVEIRKFKTISKIYVGSFISIICLLGISKILPNYQYSYEEKNIFNAVNDRSEYRCGRYTNITNRSLISCKLNTENFDKSVFLVGNSHADAIKKEFTKTASRNGFNTYFLVSNTPLMDSSVTPKMLINEANKYKIKHLIIHYAYKTIDTKKIIEMGDLAKRNGIKISYILPIPVFEETVPKIVWNNRAKYIDIKTSYVEKNKEFINELKSYTLKNSDFKLYEVADMMCPKNCLLADKEMHPYYFDTNHLTLTGSTLLLPVFEEIFK